MGAWGGAGEDGRRVVTGAGAPGRERLVQNGSVQRKQAKKKKSKLSKDPR